MNAYQSGVQERLRRAEIARAEESVRAEEATKRVELERSRVRMTIAWAGAMLGMIGMGVGGLFYISKMKADRRSDTERVVTQAIEEANLLRGQAQAAAVGDLSKWSEALATANKARDVLAAGEHDLDLEERVNSLWALLKSEQAASIHRARELDKDRRLLERLEEIRLLRFTKGDPSSDDADKRTDIAYSTALSEFGIDIDKLAPIEAGR